MEMKVTNSLLDKIGNAPSPGRIRKVVCHDIAQALEVEEVLQKMGAEYTSSRVKNKPDFWVYKTDVDRQTFYDILTGLVTVD